MNWRSVVLTTTAIAASCWWFWPDSMVTADATGPLPLAEKQEVIAPAGKTLAFSDQPVTSPTVKTQCQLPDINAFEERRAPLRQQLQLYLQQQLQDAVPYTELQRALPAQYLPDLALAQRKLLTEQAKNPQLISEHRDTLQRLQQVLGDPVTAVPQIKNSALFNATLIAPDGMASPFSLKSLLLSAAADDMVLLTQALDDVELSGSDYAIGLRHMGKAQLALLLQKTKTPAEFRMEGMNLADVAVMYLRADLLPLLASYDIIPTEIRGQYSAMDLAFTASEWPDPNQTSVHKADRQQTIRYLQQRGYVLHGALIQQDGAPALTVNSIWNYGRRTQRDNFKQIITDAARLALANEQQLEAVTTAAVPAEFAALLQPLQDEERQFEQSRQHCQQMRDSARQTQGLWTDAQIRAAIQNALKTLISPETAAAALHQQDPALADRLWPTPKKDLNIPVLDQAGRERLIARLQGAGHPIRASRALKHLQQEPALAVHWQSQNVEYLSYLQSQSNTVAFWRELIKYGFSLHLQDIHGRNLYPQAFAAGPDAVALLLEEGVAVDVPAVGPDALDVALDRSYRDKKLHPAVLTIMQKVGKPEASHLSRLRRLQQYQPEVFTTLQQALAKEPMLLAWLDDLSRYEANPVLAVADE
ncbi:MAG: hypothetical protein ACK4XG_11490 [Chromatiaceae bacterium]|jgi:hypothetical protein